MNRYKECIESDVQLNVIFGNRFSEIEKLSEDQIEKTVFYLKSIKSYYENSENRRDLFFTFSDKLDALKNSEEQLKLQNDGFKMLRKGAFLCIGSGLLIAFALVALMSESWLFFVLSIGLAFYCYYFAITKLMNNAVKIYKDQDRKYFLSSIRNAKACNELGWSGLFGFYEGFHLGAQSDEDLKNTDIQIKEITKNLRSALYNDEYFEYTALDPY